MQSLEEIRAHVIALKRKRVRMTGHRAMLARCLDEIDALTAALAEARRNSPTSSESAELAEARRALEAVEKLANEEYAGDDYSCAVYAASLLDKIRALARAALAAEPDGTR